VRVLVEAGAQALWTWLDAMWCKQLLISEQTQTASKRSAHEMKHTSQQNANQLWGLCGHHRQKAVEWGAAGFCHESNDKAAWTAS